MSQSLILQDVERHNQFFQTACNLIDGELQIQGQPDLPKPSWRVRRKLKKALHLFLEAHEIYASNSASTCFIGKIYQRLGNDESSLEWFKKAHELEPQNAMFLREATLAAMRLGLGDEAVCFAETALHISPEDFGLYDNLAMALLVSGNITEAKERAEQAVNASDDEISSNVLKLINYVLTQNLRCPKTMAEVNVLLKDMKAVSLRANQ